MKGSRNRKKIPIGLTLKRFKGAEGREGELMEI